MKGENMNAEQRSYERLIIPGDVLINHRENIICCQIENISNYGAYLKVEDTVGIYNINIGDSVTFSITTPDIPTRELSGQILRRCSDGGNIYLAVYFMQPYNLH